MFAFLENFSNKEIILFIVIFIFSMYKIFMKERVFRTNVNHKKIKEFVKFFNNKKNLKKRVSLENIVIYRFNFYIEYKILKKLIKLENPTGSMYQYIDTFNFLSFNDKKLHFRNKYFLITKRRRKYYCFLIFLFSIVSIVISFFSFIYCLAIFSQNSYELSVVVISFLYGVVFLFGSILSVKDIKRVKDAEKLVKNFNKEELHL
ncbi:hypothetical protein [Arcobacter sp.]|uniref:hypothetical protein n=1 Tax=Arcobacter sp. TaxID=1872629 RepID=UPI003D09D8D8